MSTVLTFIKRRLFLFAQDEDVSEENDNRQDEHLYHSLVLFFVFYYVFPKMLLSVLAVWLTYDHTEQQRTLEFFQRQRITRVLRRPLDKLLQYFGG